MRQHSIELDGVAHTAPIPMACRVGPILATSAISGIDPATGQPAPDADGQARLAFGHLRAVLAAGGLDLGDVVKLTVFVSDDVHRTAINRYWLEYYPDPHHRPARHTMQMSLRGVLLQLEALAVAKD